MTWENYGTVWDVDHIFPTSKANLHDPIEAKAVFNWRNLRPLSSFVNRHVKSGSVTREAKEFFEKLKVVVRKEAETFQGGDPIDGSSAVLPPAGP